MLARFEASLPPSAPVDRPLVDDLTGALRFILAFYEPGQRYLDSEAWKCAEAGGRAALARGEAALATPSVLAESTSNDCLLVAEAVRERCAAVLNKPPLEWHKEMPLQAPTELDSPVNWARSVWQSAIRSLDLSGVGVG
jgi:hypothetical protein